MKTTRKGALTEERVLVRRSDDLELLRGRVVAEPAPAGALDCRGGCVELLLQACEIIISNSERDRRQFKGK